MAVVRPMGSADVARINQIYNHYIEGTHVSFDEAPWSDEARSEWFEARRAGDRYPLLVIEEDGVVLGGAWSGPYRPRAAYAHSVETTVVLDPGAVGRGFGRKLLASLVAALRLTDAHRAYAIVALPNEASIALHRSLGYRRVGTLTDSGYKFGRYWSTEILELRLD